MGRLPFLSKKEPEPAAPTPEPAQPAAQEPQGLIIEREITLSLINDKLNYLSNVVNKIAEAAEIDLKALIK
jgi:hypothetical protein